MLKGEVSKEYKFLVEQVRDMYEDGLRLCFVGVGRTGHCLVSTLR